MRAIRVLGLLVGLALPLPAGDDFPINVYPCPRAETAPTIDGSLEEAVWQQAPLVSGFTSFETGALVDPQASFRLLWDEAALYLAVRCDEPLLDKVSPVRYAHDEHAVFGSEAIEFFVDPNHTHDLYYQLAFGIGGSLYDGEREATAWDSKARVATSQGGEGWCLEVAVPWGPLKATPAPGKLVGFNVNRDRNVGGKMWATWARVMNGFHDPQRFAHLVLSGTPEVIGRLTPEFRRGDRTGPIALYSAEGFAQTSYASLADAAFAEVEKRLAGIEQDSRQEKDPAAAAEIDRYLAACRAKIAGLRQQAAGKLDAVTWTRLDLEVQAIVTQLGKTVAEARLKALLDRI
jgi:hypothetical protein